MKAPISPTKVRMLSVSGAYATEVVGSVERLKVSPCSMPSPSMLMTSPQGIRKTEKSKASDSRTMLLLRAVSADDRAVKEREYSLQRGAG